MEERLKQRLTGAAILVALVVLIVPEMFKGRPAQRPAQLPAAPSGAPVRSYTLNLEERTPSSAPAMAVTAGEGAPTQAASAPASDAVRTSGEAGGEAAPAAVTTSSATGAAPTASEHLATAERAPSAAHPAAATAHAAAGNAHPGAASGKSGWTVQLGSFQEAEHAHRMAQQLATKGIKTMVVGPDTRGFYRVRTPAVADSQAAEALRQRLLQQGFKGVIGTTP